MFDTTARWNRGDQVFAVRHGNLHSPRTDHHHFPLLVIAFSALSAQRSAPYGPMAKPYHPCYTDVNPVENARRYTSEKVYSRKVTLIYDWLPPGREVKSWFRRVPYRLEKGDKEGSWVVKYFEFRAGIAPLPQLGFVGDLWISWDTVDPSVWFKVEEMKWERWGACASSVHRVSSVLRTSFFRCCFLPPLPSPRITP